jgi:hypothetical protein
MIDYAKNFKQNYGFTPSKEQLETYIFYLLEINAIPHERKVTPCQ